MAESMKGLKRTHRCAELSVANVGEKVTIMGWVQKNRNKGGSGIRRCQRPFRYYPGGIRRRKMRSGTDRKGS